MELTTTERMQKCIGCRWTVPQEFGGEGIHCDQRTMVEHNRCPEWVISWFLNTFFKDNGKPWTTEQLVESNKL